MFSKERSPEFVRLFVDVILAPLSGNRCGEQNDIAVSCKVFNQSAARIVWDVLTHFQALHQVKTLA